MNFGVKEGQNLAKLVVFLYDNGLKPITIELYPAELHPLNHPALAG